MHTVLIELTIRVGTESYHYTVRATGNPDTDVYIVAARFDGPARLLSATSPTDVGGLILRPASVVPSHER